MRAVTSALVELRVLEGPNLYFPRAAIKLTLDLTALIDAPEHDVRCVRAADRAAQGPSRGCPAAASGSGSRCARSSGWCARSPAEAGTTRLARPGAADQRRAPRSWSPTRGATATAPRRSGEAVAEVLDALPRPTSTRCVGRGGRGRCATPSAARARRRCGPRCRSSRSPAPTARPRPRGWSPTSPATHGLHVGWSSTDGIYVDGELVEAGDYSGPRGAGRVLAHKEVAARGHRDRARRHPAQGHRPGPQRRLGVHQRLRRPPRPAGHRHPRPARRGQGRRPADHQADGWAVLNADDPRVSRCGDRSRRSRGCSPATPTRRRSGRCSADGGRATTVIDGWLSVLDPDADPDPLVEVVDVPMTLAGLSRFNVENALGAASAALAVGLPARPVVEGLRSFRPDPEHNPGRMNFFTARRRTAW